MIVVTQREWWRSAVIYQIYPRSFADSTGDGVGDLAGIRARMPYLATLGVDAIWLSPFYRSPMIDGGYDVADFRDVDPLFGTLAGFDALVADAHGAGLRVIVDLVPNHCSSAHPWFVAALAARPGDPARDLFHFREGRGPGSAEPPNDWQSVFGGPAWTRVPDGQWYLHLFDASQPDFNWEHPQVHAEFTAILRYWLDRGVDGFRIDVAHGLVKAPGLPDAARRAELLDRQPMPQWDQNGVHEIYREWRKILDGYPGDRIAVAEAWVAPPERIARYTRSDELHQAFNFEYLMTPWEAPRLRAVIDDSLGASHAVGAVTTWVMGNHDTVRPATRYGSLQRARAGALLMLALPGSAYVYQGEELGLPEVTGLPEEALQDPVWVRSGHTVRGRDGCRVPLPWSGTEAPYGFGPGTRAWLPQPDSWRVLTAEAQTGDPVSTLELYRTALRIRRAHPGFAGRQLRWLSNPDDAVLVFARDPGLVCVVNLSTADVALPVPGPPLCASGPLSAGGLLPPDTAAWLVTEAETRR